MKNGYVECTITTCAVTGAAGSGKSHTMYLVLNEDQPEVRQSTGLVEPVRALSMVVGAGTSESGSSKWSRVDEDRLLGIVAGAISVTNAEGQPAVQTSPSSPTLSTTEESCSTALPLHTPHNMEQPAWYSEPVISGTSSPLASPLTQEQSESYSKIDTYGTSLPLASPQDIHTQEQPEGYSKVDIYGTSLPLASPQDIHTQAQPDGYSKVDIYGTSLPLASPQDIHTQEQPEGYSKVDIYGTSLPLASLQDIHTEEQPESYSKVDIYGTSLPLASPQGIHTQELPKSSSQVYISGTSLAQATPQDMCTQEQSQSSSETDISDLVSKSEQASHTEIVDEVVVKLASLLDKPVGRRRVTKLDFLYFLDSGGQPQFHELLPSFVPNLSTILFVLKLSEKLNQHPVIEYYEENRSVSSYQSPYTHEQILKHCIRALQPENRPSESGSSPNIAVVGTHRDLESQCEGETRGDKNRKLFDLLQPRFGDSLIFYDQLTDLIYPINAKNPSQEDKKVAGELRKATIRSSSPKPVQIPLPWFMLEQVLRKLAKKRGTGIMHIEECRKVASILHIKPSAFDAALKYLVSLNVFLYYPTMLPDVVFCVPQVFLDKINELVQCRHTLCGGFGILPGCATSTNARGLSGKWLRFKNYGVFKEELLQDNTFCRHYDDLFTPADFLKLLESLLIVGKVNTTDIITEYVMPSLLFELESDELDKYRCDPKTSPAAPLLVHFPDEWPTSGVFCSLVTSLLSKQNWEVMVDSSTGLYRNCFHFRHPRMPGSITLIDSFNQGYFEVHVDGNAPLEQCTKYCPEIRQSVFAALPPKAPALPEVAFFCPKSGSHCPSSLHLTDMKTCDYWSCSKNPRKVYGCLAEASNMTVWGITQSSESGTLPSTSFANSVELYVILVPALHLMALLHYLQKSKNEVARIQLLVNNSRRVSVKNLVS